MLCRVMGVKRSPYYRYRACGGKVIPPEGLVLRRRMKTLFADSRRSLGSRSMSKKLREEAFAVGRYRVSRLM
jgi:putative transposase